MEIRKKRVTRSSLARMKRKIFREPVVKFSRAAQTAGARFSIGHHPSIIEPPRFSRPPSNFFPPPLSAFLPTPHPLFFPPPASSHGCNFYRISPLFAIFEFLRGGKCVMQTRGCRSVLLSPNYRSNRPLYRFNFFPKRGKMEHRSIELFALLRIIFTS